MPDRVVCTCTAHPRHVVLPHLADGLAMLRGSFWPLGYTLKVAFKPSPTEIQDRVMAHARRWSEFGDVDFAPVALRMTPGAYDVLVGFDQPGYWSMVGTGSRQVPIGESTLNLEDFDSGQMPESEWTRVVCHEVGHALGALHEQQRGAVIARLNPAAVIAEFRRTQGWSEEEIRQQILTPMNEAEVIEGPEDDYSIMMYSFSPSLTYDGKGIVGGKDITEYDKLVFSTVYPGRWTPTGPPPAPPPPAPPPGPPIPANPGLVEVPLRGKAALGHTGLLKPAEFWLVVPSSRTVRFDASVQGTAWLHLPPTLDIVAAGATGGLRLPLKGGPAIWSGQAPLAAGGYTLRLSSPNPLHAAVAYLKAT
jgi:hypothetical protein